MFPRKQKGILPSMDSIKEIKEYIEKNFSDKRKLHTEGVRITATELARKYGADPAKAEIAALFHDMYRGVSENSLNYYVRNLGLDDRYLNNCNLAHGKIAAIVMERDFEISDKDIINAVAYHTTGRANMSLLEKIIYLADAIEPSRAYPGVDELRRLAEGDLDRACLLSLSNTINFVRASGKFLDEDTIRAKEALEREIEEREEKDDK